MTHAPLVVKDKVIVGVGGGEYGIRGFIAAYDAATGKEFGSSTPFPDPASLDTRHGKLAARHRAYCDPDGWKHGGGSVWVTGSYDPELNLTYWGVGNAGSGL